MHFLVSALGSAGDVHPFIAISQALLGRGHDVTLIAPPPFADRVRAAGVVFSPLGEPGEFERVVEQAALWNPLRGTRIVFDELLRNLPEAYATTAALAARPDTVLVGSTLSWGMRLVQERTGLAGATVHLSPVCITSALQPPRLPGIGDLRWVPLWMRRRLQGATERWVLDRWMGPPLNRVRADLGLPPVDRIWSRWMHAPDLVIGAWPEWYAPRQPDWPPAARTTGFPLFEERGLSLSAELEDFLAPGPAPIGITPGSAMAHGERFFAKALAACRAAGRRALLISPYRDQLPASLPDGALHVAYAPFSALLPRLALLVHHGGIGTCAQALAAGRTQLVVPFAHDQFDNAARLERLGVARTLRIDSLDGEWGAALRTLTDSGEIAAAVTLHADRMRSTGPASALIARELERLGTRRGTSARAH